MPHRPRTTLTALAAAGLTAASLGAAGAAGQDILPAQQVQQTPFAEKFVTETLDEIETGWELGKAKLRYDRAPSEAKRRLHTRGFAGIVVEYKAEQRAIAALGPGRLELGGQFPQLARCQALVPAYAARMATRANRLDQVTAAMRSGNFTRLRKAWARQLAAGRAAAGPGHRIQNCINQVADEAGS